MTVVIFKNNEYQKSFKKFFPCYVTSEIYNWTKEHFTSAKKKAVDLKTKFIYIYY